MVLAETKVQNKVLLFYTLEDIILPSIPVLLKLVLACHTLKLFKINT